MTRLVIVLHVVTLCFVEAWWAYGRSLSVAHVSITDLYLVLDGMYVLGLLLTLCRKSARSMQRCMWRVIQVCTSGAVLIDLYAIPAMSLRCGHLVPFVTWDPAALVLLGLLWNPTWRQYCHSRLAKIFERRSENLAAASIAGLVGACRPREVLAESRLRFRSVCMADITLDDLRDNAPNPELFSRSTPEHLGDIDAFFSHSWHDDCEVKWQAMQQWRDDFVAEHGREPRVWIDKWCIDQHHIETDLRCLPVFLSGCQKFVVFCGPTYLNRLWCIVEIFTFVQMCRAIDNIQVQLLLPEGSERQSAQSAVEAFEHFDAQRCDCFLAEDKERMLTIILAAFGDLGSFNKEVAAIFSQVGFKARSLEDVAREKETSAVEGVEIV